MPALTFSGNEVTDAIRATQGQGSGGLLNDSSVELWAATTNGFSDGGFESGIDSWVEAGTLLVQSAEQAHAGTDSLRATVTGGSSFQRATHAMGTLGPGVYVFSAWLYSPDSLTKVRLGASNVTDGQFLSSMISVGASWTKLFLIFEVTVNEAIQVQIYVNHGTNLTGGERLYIDDVTFEPRHEPSPTNLGGTPAGRITGPSSLLNTTQGWFACRVRLGWAAANPTSQYHRIFDFGMDNFNGLHSFFKADGVGATEKWTVKLEVGDVGDPNLEEVYHSIAQTHNIDDHKTIIVYWKADELAVSVDGSAFTKIVRTLGEPDMAGVTTFDIGRTSWQATTHLNGDFFWAACGTGTFLDSQAAALNALGDTDPDEDADFFINQVPTMLWKGVDANYITAFTLQELTSAKRRAIMLSG